MFKHPKSSNESNKCWLLLKAKTNTNHCKETIKIETGRFRGVSKYIYIYILTNICNTVYAHIHIVTYMYIYICLSICIHAYCCTHVVHDLCVNPFDVISIAFLHDAAGVWCGNKLLWRCGKASIEGSKYCEDHEPKCGWADTVGYLLGATWSEKNSRFHHLTGISCFDNG